MKNLNFLDLNSVLVCATGYIKQAELTTLKHQKMSQIASINRKSDDMNTDYFGTKSQSTYS